MEDFHAAQVLLGSAGAVVIVGLVQFFRPVWAGLVPAEWETRGIPFLTLGLAAIWQIIVVNVLYSLATPVTWNGWILGYLTILCALTANGLYSGPKAVAGR